MNLFKDSDIEKIKDSFNALNEKAPDFIWENLDKQLYIDRIWLKIKNKLDKIQIIRKRRKTIIVSIAASLIIAFFLTNIFIDKFQYKSPVSVNETKRKEFNLIKDRNKTINPYGKSNKTTKNINLINNFDSSYMELNIVSQNKQDVHNLPLTNSSSNLSSNAYQHDVLNINKTKEIDLNVKIDSNSFQYYDADINEILSYINTLKIKTIPLKNELKNIVIINKINDSVLSFHNHYEIGIIYLLNNTILINNQYKESLIETSLVDRIPAFNSNCGIIFNYYFSLKNALAIEYLFTNKESQISSIFKNGKYYRKNLELDYSKISLMLQKKMYSVNNKFFSNYFIKGGCYFAYLKNYENYFKNDDEIIYDTTYNYSSIDYGFKIGVGIEKNIKNFILGYGFDSAYGLKNIFTGNKYTPAWFDRTNNFNLGINFTLKYKIN